MYKPISLEARNFQSFENLSYNFKVGKATLIEGENLSDDGQKTNGSGKSTFGEIIYYLLLGTSSTGKRDMKLIRWGQKSASIAIELDNEYNHQRLRIERTLYSNSKPSTLDIFLNGVSQKDRFSSVTEGNKLILDILDISAEDIKNYYLVNRNRFVSFFDSPDSAKRGLLARFSNVERLLKVGEVLDNEIKELELNITKTSQEIISLESKIEILKSQLSEKESRNIYQETKEKLLNEVKSYKSRILSIDEELCENEAKNGQISKIIGELEGRLDELNKKIASLNEIDFDKRLEDNSSRRQELQQKIDDILNEKRGIENESAELQKQLQPILVKLNGLIVCPKCHTEFTLQDKDFDVESAKMIVEETKDVIKELLLEAEKKSKEAFLLKSSNDMSALVAERAEICKERDGVNNHIYRIKIDEIKPLLAQIGQQKRSAEELASQRTRLISEKSFATKSVVSKEAEIKSLQENMQDPEIPKLKLMIDDFSSKVNKLNSDKIELTDKVMKRTQWKERFKQFYVSLTNKTLLSIQDQCNLCLKDIKSDLEIKLDGFRVLANGTIKEAVSASVSRNGCEPDDFKCFSGGERGRAVFATILTFQQMINERSSSGGLDLLMIDEVLDQVDAYGMGLFVDSLEPLDKTIFIVSQVKTEAPVENILTVTKINGISYICNS